MKFDKETIDTIRQSLLDTNERVAAAESVTAGFLQAALASAENASTFFQGGITAYNIDQKVRHLDIDRSLGEACNCVSSAIAEQMANGVVRLFRCEWGIAVTGYATPVPESGNRVYCHYAICHYGRVVAVDRIDLHNNEAEDAQLQFVNVILAKFAALCSRPVKTNR
jgi:nicotinamide-nucleotide amidase